MQTAVCHQTKMKRYRRNEVKPVQEDSPQNDYAITIMQAVTEGTYSGVQSLKVDLEPNRVMLTGFCDSYYTKQLAQQAVMAIVLDREIVNDIVVL